MFNTEIKHKWILSFIVVLLLFLAVSVFLFPLFNSGDDVFLMYTSGGGFGESPTNLLQYNYGWHPVLGWIVKTLFQNFPGINWYTALLMLFQVSGCTALLYVLFNRFQFITALILFLVLFFFFEIRILLSFSYSSSSWVLATGGYILLLMEISGNCKRVNLFIACLLILLAGLLRIQIVLMVTVLFLPWLLVNARKEYKKWAPAIITVGSLLFLFNIQHQNFYRNQIPGWQKQEQIRQSFFYASNRPIDKEKPWNQVFSDKTERAFYYNQFFYDTTFISPIRIEKIGKALVRKRNFRSADDYQVLYWVFIEWRVYLLLFGICFFLVWQKGVLKKVLQRWWIPAFFVFAAYSYLLLFLKLTETLHIGLLMMLWLYFILAIPGRQLTFATRANRFPFFVLLLLMPFFWMGIRMLKKNQDNRKKYQQFLLIIPEIIKNADKLFIATDDALPLDYFYIWDSPVDYQLPNLIYKDRVIAHTYTPTLERFGIFDIMQSLYANPHVFLLGRAFPELKQYYKDTYNIDIAISEKLGGYKWLEVRKASDSSGYLISK